ncbi:MAG: HAD family phosphatase [Eubacterium sp.]|nr:HAD family phosphatase [Eubacterium sp.]
MDFDAVLFDMDGVIFDSEVKVVECWKEVADKYGIPDIESQCHACLGTTREMSRTIMLEHYGADFPYDTYKKEMSDLFHIRYGGGRLPKKAGAAELLKFLQLHNKKVALASSTRREIVEQELRDGGLISYFDAVICGDMVQRSKPEPDIFLKACAVLGVEPKRAFGVEDSYNGIRALAAAEIPAIMVPDLKSPTEEIRSLATAVLPDLFAVKKYLERPDGRSTDV